MTKTGLEIIKSDIASFIGDRKVSVLCHAASIDAGYNHIIDILKGAGVSISAVFGPQHGLFGQTQDNMIEWESGSFDENYGAYVYSLYGKNRAPLPSQLEDTDLFIVDLQDVGARPYTYIWTMKNVLEVCERLNIEVMILDRPNPIAAIDFDGVVLNSNYFTFVGGANVPLCHRMSIGELSLFLKRDYFPDINLRVVSMEGWKRDMMFSDTGLPWVLPSPNMPTLDTAVVYPGMVLFEALNVSEGRGTTRPFELFGAPFIDRRKFITDISSKKLEGIILREHGFIPTYQKWASEFCTGFQIHVTDLRSFKPVYIAIELIDSIIKSSPDGMFGFKQPPYEYEYEKMPFDILWGDDTIRKMLLSGDISSELKVLWQNERTEFVEKFNTIKIYD